MTIIHAFALAGLLLMGTGIVLFLWWVVKVVSQHLNKELKAINYMQQELFITEKQKEGTLKNFMLEHFDFTTLKKVGFYGKEIKRKDYKAQAERVCLYFGYKTVFEYGTVEIRCHISYAEGERPTWIDEKGELKTTPFVEVFKSWLDD